MSYLSVQQNQKFVYNSMKILWILLSCLLISGQSAMFRKYYKQALQIAKSMSLEQKIGQTLQMDFGAFANSSGTYPQDAAKYFLGSLLVGGNGAPDENGNLIVDYGDEDQSIRIYANATTDKWQKLAEKFNYDINITTGSKQYHIKPFLATDAVHNNQHIAGTILFPHNSGLSCSHNPQHFYNTGKWTGINVKASGFNYAFAPTVAVSHNPQWGRFYESMGSDVDMIRQYGQAYVEGLQGKQGSSGVIGSAKHFIGDGATMYGADEGNVRVSSFSTFIQNNVQGYIGAVQADIATVMCSYSAINWVPMAISPLIPTVLRQDVQFDGFVISDYDELARIMFQKLPTSFQSMDGFKQTAPSSMNAGIDMMMLPPYQGETNIQFYFQGMKTALSDGTITEERLDDAVAKILAVKLAFGLVNDQQTTEKPQQPEHTTTEYEDSLAAVHESLVLLKNDQTLPMKKENLEYIVLVGERSVTVGDQERLYQSFNNIGMQCGGWSLRWQGFEGNGLWEGRNKEVSNASSILDALKLEPNTKYQIVYPSYSDTTNPAQIQQEREDYLNGLDNLLPKMNSSNTILIGVVGQSPFAEFAGDVGIPYCQKDDPIGDQGCMYNPWLNPYLHGDQRASLHLEFEEFDHQVINKVREKHSDIPLVSVIVSGRPMLIPEILSVSDAVLDAFLPGTSGGQGIVDGLMGSYKIRPKGDGDRTNTLAFDWPSTAESVRYFPVYGADGKIPKIANPLFAEGYGLSTA